MSGVLYLVGTPIGNLEDFSPRAAAVLRAVDLVLAEDTRHSRRLLEHFGIKTPLAAWHAHNEEQRLESVLQRLDGGQQLALVSDAGMPLVSDPGFPLVRAARERGHRLECVGGPTALIHALVVSGLPCERFAFEGFLPAKSAARRARLAKLSAELRSLVFYEAPHRLRDCLEDLCAELGAERSAFLGRELTKRFESHYTGTLGSLRDWAIGPDAELRGEMVLVVAPAPLLDAAEVDVRRTLRLLLQELPARRAARLVARLHGGRANDHYQTALSLQADDAAD